MSSGESDLRIFGRLSSGLASIEVSSLNAQGWTIRGADGRASETRLCLRAGKSSLSDVGM